MAIVLNVRKYNDRNNIITVFSRAHGRLSFISPVGQGKGGNARRARLQPLAVINSDFTFKPTSELQRLGSVSLQTVWSDLYFHPFKRAISIFISEFLYRLLNATMPDEKIWDFIYGALTLLDSSKGKIANFHIAFLVSLLPFSGIQPDLSEFREDWVFDLGYGGFVAPQNAKGPYLKGEEAKAVIWINRINFSNMSRLKLTTSQRNEILQGLMAYYSYHFPGLSSLNSPSILHDLFL